MTITPTELGTRASISRGYACDLLAKKKKPSAPMAVRIFKATGLKLGLLEGLSDADVAAAERMHG